MIKLLSIYFLYSFLLGCSERELVKEKIFVSSTEDGYIIHVDNNNLIRVTSDTFGITQLVFNDEEAITLDFYIIEPYLTDAYLCDIDSIGRTLILESFPVGASGFSANIINVSIIALDKDASCKVLSYNSFYGGADLLKYQGEKIVLDIYDHKGFTKKMTLFTARVLLSLWEMALSQKKQQSVLPIQIKG